MNCKLQIPGLWKWKVTKVTIEWTNQDFDKKKTKPD